MTMKREQAIEYAKLIWQRMAETGQDKEDTIDDLVEEGLLPPQATDWHMNCPFCEHVKVLPTGHFKVTHMECEKCPWPRYAEDIVLYRCDHDPKSPYYSWFEAYSSDDHGGMCEAAGNVYSMLCELEG